MLLGTLSTLNMEARVTGDDPDTQVVETIELMSEYVRRDVRSPQVQELAQDLAGDTPQETLDSIFDHVQRLVRFQADETTARPLKSRLVEMGVGDYPVVEVLIPPADMLTWRQDTGTGQAGDCDDFAMLTAALVMASGMKAVFVTAAADYRVPGQWSHVYVAAYTQDGRRVALDTSHGEYAGWEVQDGVTRRQEWQIDGHRGLIVAAVLALVLWAQWAGRWMKRRTR